MVLLQRRESAVGTGEPACSIGGRFGLDFKVVCMCMCAWGACVWVEGITLLHYLGFRNNHAIAIS